MISTTWYNTKRYLKIYIILNMISVYPLTRILVSLIQELVSTIAYQLEVLVLYYYFAHIDTIHYRS